MNEQIETEQYAQLVEAILRETKRQPPTICVIGCSGTGKSTLLNALFNTDLKTSPTIACTKKFISTDVCVAAKKGAAKGISIPLRVIDSRGLGEDYRIDDDLLRQCVEQLPAADVVLYVASARSRAVALDQRYLSSLRQFSKQMVFGLSNADLVEPLNWNQRLNRPSAEQTANIAEIAKDRANRFSSALDQEVEVIPFSSKRGFNLERLFASILMAAPEPRGWLFDALKAFSYRDFVPKDALELIEGSSVEGS